MHTRVSVVVALCMWLGVLLRSGASSSFSTCRPRPGLAWTSSVSGSQVAAHPNKIGHVSIITLACEWQTSSQNGFCGDCAACATFQNRSSVGSIFRNFFILGFLSPCDDKVAMMGELSFPTAPNSGQSPMSHLITCPKLVPLKPLKESRWTPRGWSREWDGFWQAGATDAGTG